MQNSWKILLVLTASISMVFIDVTVLPVTLPTLQRDLGLSHHALQWIVNAYTLVLTMFVLISGRVGDHIGLKKMFCIGMSVFAIASFLCGMGTSAWELIMSRALQGIGGACMLPAAQGMITHTFPSHKRGKALGFFIGMGSISLALGPLFGGYCSEYLSWHYVFWINLPIAALGLFFTWLIIPHYPRHQHVFHLPSLFLYCLSVLCIIGSIMQAPIWGWLSYSTIGVFLLGVILFILLLKSDPSSFIPKSLLRIPPIRMSLTLAFLGQFLLMIAFFWSIFFQTQFHYSPFVAGNLAFLANAPIIVMGPIAGYCVDRWGSHLPMIFGLILIGFAFIGMDLSSKEPSLHLLIPSLLCFGTGLPAFFAPNATELLNAAPKEQRGTSSALLIATRQFSATVGLAIFGAIYQPWTSIERFDLINFIGIGLVVVSLLVKICSKRCQ